MANRTEGGSVPPSPVVGGDDPYVELALAIVFKAADDYRQSLKRLKKHDTDTLAYKMKRECEMFFASSWCKLLTEVDMVDVAKQIRQEVFG